MKKLHISICGSNTHLLAYYQDIMRIVNENKPIDDMS